jgi:hypothetical protein
MKAMMRNSLRKMKTKKKNASDDDIHLLFSDFVI